MQILLPGRFEELRGETMLYQRLAAADRDSTTRPAIERPVLFDFGQHFVWTEDSGVICASYECRNGKNIRVEEAVDTGPKILDAAYVNKARTARHLLPDPGPEVVGDFIATLDAIKAHVESVDITDGGCMLQAINDVRQRVGLPALDYDDL